MPSGERRGTVLGVVGSTEQGIREQWSEVEAHLASDVVVEVDAACLRRRGAFGIRPSELVSEAWLRLSVTFDRREEPFPVWGGPAAQKLVARAIDSSLIDLLRRSRPTDIVPVERPPDGMVLPSEHVEQADALRTMISFINAHPAERGKCAGCRPGVVVAAALAVVHQIAAGAEPPGRGDDMARLLTSALLEVCGDIDAGARRQRRRRCGPCVRSLIEQAMEAAGMMGER